VKYTSAAAFRQALEQRLKNEAASTGIGLARLRKRVAFELFLRRLILVAPDSWVLKGALALDFRLAVATRPTKDIDLSRQDDEQAAIRDITAAQRAQRAELCGVGSAGGRRNVTAGRGDREHYKPGSDATRRAGRR
jgi:hypothetical protein